MLAFNKVKYLFFIPLVGLLTFLIVNNSQPNLISFVLDNSASMDEEIEIGKATLRRTIREFDENTDFVVSTFEEPRNGKTSKSSISEITGYSTSTQLLGRNEFFSGQAKDAAINYINTLGDDLTGSSPLCETMWSNFLFVGTLAQEEKKYGKIISIVITDGKSSLAETEGFLCENTAYFDFFEEPTDVNFITLDSGSYSEFLESAEGCGYKIWDGYDATSFNNSLNDILKNFKKDNSFIVLLWIIYFLFLFLTLMTFLKKPR